MANARELKSRMQSIEDTRKITSAMYLISSSKLRHARAHFTATEPYFYTLQNSIARLLRHAPDIRHEYLDRECAEGEIPKRGYLVVTADKGMAGAFNQNVLKLAQSKLEEEGEHKLFVVGQIGRAYFQRRGIDYDTHFQYTIQKPTIHRAREIAGTLLELYRNGSLDQIDIIYTRMINGMESEAEIRRLLPLQRASVKGFEGVTNGENLNYLPSPEEVLNKIVPNYVTGFIYGALVESYSAEQNARMSAMQSATESADKMVQKLQMDYNRVRQASITCEITEVAAGARAQRREDDEEG